MKYIYVIFEFKQTIFYFSGSNNNNNNNNNSNFITCNAQIRIWMYMINARYRNRLIYIKRVLTKDLKVVKFFSCVVWRGRAKTSSWCRIFSSRSRSRFESFFVYCFIVISILLNATFWKTSIQSQSVVNIL